MYGKLIPNHTHRRRTIAKDMHTPAFPPGRDEKKGSYVPDNLPGCLELDEDFFRFLYNRSY